MSVSAARGVAFADPVRVYRTQDFLRAEVWNYYPAILELADARSPQECQQLVVPEAVAKTLPLPVLQKAGWAKGAGGSGFVNAKHPYLALGITA